MFSTVVHQKKEYHSKKERVSFFFWRGVTLFLLAWYTVRDFDEKHVKERRWKHKKSWWFLPLIALLPSRQNHVDLTLKQCFYKRWYDVEKWSGIPAFSTYISKFGKSVDSTLFYVIFRHQIKVINNVILTLIESVISTLFSNDN